MPRCSTKTHALTAAAASESEAGPKPEPSPAIVRFWEVLPLERRRKLLCVDRKSLFTRIRQQFCSRCFGLFVLRYEEMKGASALDCPACQELYAGLAVSEGGVVAVEESILETEPFTLFAEGKLREREREIRFMAGDICGSGFQKRPGNNMCALHCSPVPSEALAEYFQELPEEHKQALLTLREEDFAAELDAHLKYQLRICRDCRFNVMRAYRDLKQPVKSSQAEQPNLELCPDFNLKVAERLVTVHGDNITQFLHRAEDVEGCKALDGEDPYGNPDHVRHAETPELAKEALIDSAVLIYKGQIEVAFREQTAGHNALLLFVGLALRLMEEQLLNAFRELEAKEAEAELLDLVAKEKEKAQPSAKKKKGKKASRQQDREEMENEGSKDQPAMRQCQKCVALQQGCRCTVAAPVGKLAASVQLTSPLCSQPAAALVQGGPAPPASSPLGRTQRSECEAGEWEIQHSKRRGLAQALKKSGVASSLGGSSSGSTTPERRHPSSEAQPPRSRSPFARRVITVPSADAPKRMTGQRNPTVPVHAYSCSGLVPPPPPPPPRELKQASRIPAEPSPRNAWQIGHRQPEPRQSSRHGSALEWTPWSGPSPQLGSTDLHLVGASSLAALAPAPPPLLSKSVSTLLTPDAFSFFHISPVPDPESELKAGSSSEKEAAGYQLFGSAHSSYPLAPLGTVLSL